MLGTSPLGALVLGGAPGDNTISDFSDLGGYSEFPGPDQNWRFIVGLDNGPLEDCKDPFVALCEIGENFLLPYLSLESMFTDARASVGETIPRRGESRRGWWGHNVTQVNSWRNQAPRGSKIWTLTRVTISEVTEIQFKRAIEYAHKWMIDAGLLKSATAHVAKSGLGGLAAVVTLELSDGRTTSLEVPNVLEGYKNVSI